jgi:glycerol uptake facilitator protein
VGTFMLCLIGPGVVAAAVLTGAHQGLWQVASVWAFGIALTIYAVGAISGCHINPAVTIAMAIYRPASFPWRKVLPYIGAQFSGGILAALVLYLLWNPTCIQFEAEHGIVRGEPGSQLSAMWFGEYFPNPALYGTDAKAFAQVSPAVGFAAEALGTAILLFCIMALTDPRNPAASKALVPLMVGLTVGVVISILAPLSQAGLNPARDLAPRIVSYFAGWGRIAIPGPRGCEWWVYVVAPIVGGVVGAGVHQVLRGGLDEADSLPHIEKGTRTHEGLPAAVSGDRLAAR